MPPGQMVRNRGVLETGTGIELEFTDGRVSAQVTENMPPAKKAIKKPASKPVSKAIKNRGQGSLF